MSPLAPSGPANNANVTFGVGPASKITVKAGGVTKTELGIDGRPYFYYNVTPGAAFKDNVAFVNIGFKPVTLSVYATDALNGPDGSFGLLPGATKPKDLGAWIHLLLPAGVTSLAVPARSTVVVPIVVSIPVGTTPGDHTGGLIASLASQAKDSNGDVVTLDQRVGTRMFVRVSGMLRPALSVEDLSASYHGTLNPFGTGSAIVTYTVRNTGNLRLAGKQTVKISGLLGSTGDPTTVADIPLLLPGGSMKVTVQVSGVRPAIWMTGTVSIEPLGLKGDVDPALGTITASTHFWAIPWVLLGILVLLVLLAGWWWRRRSRVGGTPEAAIADELKEPVTA